MNRWNPRHKLSAKIQLHGRYFIHGSLLQFLKPASYKLAVPAVEGFPMRSRDDCSNSLRACKTEHLEGLF